MTEPPKTVHSSYCAAAAGHAFHGPYHDYENGFPLGDDDQLFERLVLEINQAGLSWLTILKKREGFRRAYDGFRIKKVAAYGDADRERLLGDAGIIRNRLKISAAIENAHRILALREAYGSFGGWLDAHHPLGRAEWQKLFKRTFVFTGGEIVGEFLMSTGYLPGAHVPSCPVHPRILETGPPGHEWRLPVTRRAVVSETGGTSGADSDLTAILNSCPPAVRELVQRLRMLVCSSLDDPEERVYTGWRGLGYHDEMAGYVCGIFPRRATVRLLFEHGASLDDPDRVFTGGGSQTRYVELAPHGTVPEEAIRDMIRRAVLAGSLRAR